MQVSSVIHIYHHPTNQYIIICISLFLLRNNSLQLGLQLLVCPLEEVDLFSMFFPLGLFLLLCSFLNHLTGYFQIRDLEQEKITILSFLPKYSGYLFFQACFLFLQFSNVVLHICFTLLSLKSFSYTESYA